MEPYRFFIVDDVPSDQIGGDAFGADTVGIADENAGGIILYIHATKADQICEMLNRAAT